jgi:hypothetical protein
MKRKLALLGVFVGVLCAFGMLMSGGVGAAAPRTSTMADISFTEGLCGDSGAHCKSVRAGKDPLGFGTRLIFTIPLYSEGATIGEEQGECVFLQKKSHLYFCTYNLLLAEGSVSVQGTLDSSGKAGTIPVTGGIGGYEGAYGDLHEVEGFPAQYELHVVTP